MNPYPQLAAFAGGAEPFLLTARGGLDAILHRQPTASAVVLVLNNAIAARDRELFDQATGAAWPYLVGAEVDELTPDQELMEHMIWPGRDPFSLIETRRVGNLLVAFHPLRAKRERREADASDHVVHRPYDPGKFGFSSVPEECFWREPWRDWLVRWYFNKTPYQHGNFVVAPELGREQFLTEADAHFMWALYFSAAAAFPRAFVGYASLGAYSSVNEIHMQVALFGAGAGVPAEVVNAQELHSPGETWQHVHRIQAANRPFNLVLYGGQVHLVEREFQGQERDPLAGNTGLSSWELALGMLMTDRVAYDDLTEAAALAALRGCVPALVPAGR